MALAWIFSVLGLLLTTHAAFFWCCCNPVNPCSTGSWPTTLYLTFGGNTYTLTADFFRTVWSAQVNVATATKLPDCSADTNNSQVLLNVECIANVITVSYYAHLGPCPPPTPPANSGPCYLFSNTGFGTVAGRVGSTIATFSNSPISGTGSWSTWISGTGFCTSLPAIPISGSWTLSQ